MKLRIFSLGFRLSPGFRLLPGVLALGMAGLFTGCRSTPPAFPTPQANWHTSHGQLQYVTPRRSVIGEAVVSRYGMDDFQLDFAAGPGVPLMKFQQTRALVRAEGLFAYGSWQGERGHLPRRLVNWGALSTAFTALNLQSDTPRRTAHSLAGATPVWSATAEQSPGQPQRISVEFPKTQERFVFVLGR